MPHTHPMDMTNLALIGRTHIVDLSGSSCRMPIVDLSDRFCCAVGLLGRGRQDALWRSFLPISVDRRGRCTLSPNANAILTWPSHCTVAFLDKEQYRVGSSRKRPARRPRSKRWHV